MNELKTLQEEFDRVMLNTEVRIIRDGQSIYDTSGEEIKAFIQKSFTLGLMKGVEESSNHFRTEIDKLYVFGTSTAVGGLYTDEKMRGDNVEVASWIKKEDVLAIELPDYKLKQELK